MKSKSAPTLALIAMLLWGGAAHAAPRKLSRHAVSDDKSIREPKTVQRSVFPRRRLITFYERFYPGMGRTFTTWW